MDISSQQDVFQVKCRLHPNNQSDVLHVAADSPNYRACLRCVLEGSVPNFAALELRSLFQEDNDKDNIFSYYPPLGDSTIYKRLQNLQQYSDRKTIQQIEQKIGDFKLSFEEILDKFKKKSINQAEELGKQRRQVLDLYKSMCEPNRLKEAVIQAAETQDESNLKEIIVGKCKETNLNQSKILSVISQFEANKLEFLMRLDAQFSQFSKNLLKVNRNFSLFTPTIIPLIHSESILKEFQLIPSKLWESEFRAVLSREENNQLDIECIQKYKYPCEFYSKNSLASNAYYSFRFRFHKESAKVLPQFYIGIINSEEKNQLGFRNLIRYKEHSENCDINTIIKGSTLNSPWKPDKLHKEVEMRVHLSSRTIQVADFPNYQNVVQLAQKNLIWEGSQYNLYVALGFVNYHITLTDVIISNGFDNLM